MFRVLISLNLILLLFQVFIAISEMYIFQLNSYNIDLQLIWYKKHLNKYMPNIILIVFILLDKILGIIPNIIIILIITVCILTTNVLNKKIKKFNWTKRMIRLFIAIVILLILSKIICVFSMDRELSFIFFAFTPMISLVGFIIMNTVENQIKKGFIKKAKIELNKKNPYVIGITGSFGKTSVKNYLYNFLSSRYLVCKTPLNYNTTLGVTKTIDENLKGIDDIFICEMGARRKNDIKEICDIVEPFSCIITEVGNQHLDTFKNIENVLNTKFELVDSVIKNYDKDFELLKNNDVRINKKFPLIIVNGDNDLIYKKINDIKNKVKYNNIFSYGEKEYNDFIIKNMDLNIDGTTFDIEINNKYISESKKVFNLKTMLLGNHNIKNLTACIAFSYLLGISEDDIKNITSKITGVSHRLELIKLDDNNIIIDDAYNSNVVGSKEAVNVLQKFFDYTKIIITPGIVELGNKQYEENFNFAKNTKGVVDYFIVVSNANKNALLKGARENIKSCYENKDLKDISDIDYENNIIYFNNEIEAINFAKSIKADKKVILLLNDITDNYN